MDSKELSNIVKPVPHGIKRPLWSVMIPTFNPGKYFVDAINSVISQDPGPEIMQIDIVDDCSTKVDIPKIIEENWKGRVGYHRLPKNVGHSFNFTEAVRRAKGQLVHLLHDDDKVKPGFYEKFAAIFRKYEEAGAVFCRQEYIDDDDQFMFYSEPEMDETGILKDAVIRLAEKQRIQYCAMAVRRKVYEQIGGYIPKNIGCEDWEMWVRIAAHFPVAYEPEALALYRIHRKSMTLTDMRSGQDMRFLREAADIFTQYVPEEKREEVTLFRNKHYAVYSFNNAKRMFEEFNDEEGAAAQLSETIILDSELVHQNIDFLSKFNISINGAGVSVIVRTLNNAETIEKTIGHLLIQRVPKYIPWEIIIADNDSTDDTLKIISKTWRKFRCRANLKIIRFKGTGILETINRAIDNASYNFVLFCNPGDLLSRNYVHMVSLNMMRENKLAVIGGYTEAIIKCEKPQWFDDWSNYSYQTGEQYEYTNDITWTKGTVWSSGMAVKKEAWKSLSEKNFRSVFENTNFENAVKGIVDEHCYALRLTGWRIRYSIDLKLKHIFIESDLSWKQLRNIWKQDGTDFIALYNYIHSQEHKADDFRKFSRIKNRRELITAICHKLRRFKRWKLFSYKESLTGDTDILLIEYKFAKLRTLLGEIKSYNRKIRILRRISAKRDFKYLKYAIDKPYFKFPQYSRKNDRRGISVILNYENASYDLLNRALGKISKQVLPEGFRWEVILTGKHINENIKAEIYRRWERSNCSASLIISGEINQEPGALWKTALSKSSFDYLVFLNELIFIEPDFIRIAYKSICKNKKAGIITGQTELTSDVNPPKWFSLHKELYGIGKPADDSGEITFSGKFFNGNGIIVRKRALMETDDNEFYISKITGDNGLLSEAKDFALKIKSAGWKIYYEPRLKIKRFVKPKEFSWEYLRNQYRKLGAIEVGDSVYSKLYNLQNENSGGKSWLKKANETLLELNKYPYKKIFSKKDEFRNDTDVLEIEKLQGRFKELLEVRNKYDKIPVRSNIIFNGFKNALISQNGTGKKDKQNGVSIVVCCYNSSQLLPSTLGYIFRQEVPEDIPWEVIIVDNASTDNTSQTAHSIWVNSNCLCSFKIVKETKPGLSAARLKGYQTAKYEYIVLCDDDNWLHKDFVKNVYNIMNANKDIGVLGGQSKAEFDKVEPEWFKKWQDSFAVGQQSEISGDITNTRGYVWGAAMVVRKEAWKNLLSSGFSSILSDRKGNLLSSGGDTEICYALRNAGWKIWYDPELKFKHYISDRRLNWEYVRKLFRGFGQASPGLDQYLIKSRVKLSETPSSSPMKELRKNLSLLRTKYYRKLLRRFDKENNGVPDIPMIEYTLGRIEGLLKTKRTYNRSIRLLKRSARKKDLRNLKVVFGNSNKNFPRYKTIKKFNGVSIIVCTYNGEERLPETIKHIAKQKVDPEILWELILVDNASTDNSKQATINEWKKHKCSAQLRIIDQPVPGKQLALEKGYEVARYEYLITCDDDNWLDENFVQLTFEIMSSNSNIGALGGPNEPLCETKPPDWFKYFQRDYAAGPQGDIHTGVVSEGNITWKRGYVWGAGMIVRKSAWEKLLADGFRTSMSCRKGTELSSGGDSEACYALVLAGWEIWYDPRLKLKHCMPAGRLDWNYLVRLFTGFGVASVGLEPYEKAIQLGRSDIIDEEIKKQDWKYEFKKTLKALRGYGLKKILSLRFPTENRTDILMLEFNISRLKELMRVRKEYDKNFEELLNAPWKKNYNELKASHKKYIESGNDYRYGWPWSDEPEVKINPEKIYPKISVLSPSFNSAGTIEKAILSVMKQGYPNYEHIVCDAGSADGTVEILKKYPHLKWVSEKDKGQSDAMNKAFEMSDGEIIVYLNTDDYFQRGAFHKIAKAFEENPSAEMIVGNLIFDFANHTFMRKPEIEYKKVMLPFLYMFPINPVSYFYKRKVQTDIGPFPLDNHFTMDYWFLLKAYQNHKLVKIEDFLGTFCMNGYNKTSNADNRKNTHVRVLYHCWNYDRKMLPFYLYNYYKFFYYDKKTIKLRSFANKIKSNISRAYSLLTLKKNKYYSQKLYEQSRYRYYENKRIRSVFNGMASFLIYPKGISQRSRQSQFVYSILGQKYSEKAKLAYLFFTTPPGLPLSNKLHYYGRKFKNERKFFKGNSLLLLTYLISPKFIFKDKDYGYNIKKSVFYYLNPLNWVRSFFNFFRYKRYKSVSYNFYSKAGEKYHYRKNIQAVIAMTASFLVYPMSLRKSSRLKFFCYAFFGRRLMEKFIFAKHLYQDNPEYSLAHKLNYYGHELRRENSAVKGNLILIFAYILSPKYILKREKIKKSNIVYVSNYIETTKKFSFSPSQLAGRSVSGLRKLKNVDIGTGLRNSKEKFIYKMKLGYYYFRYRKYKAKSKQLYSKAIENYANHKRLDTVLALIPSYILYPVSLFNRNKMSLMVNALLGNLIKKKEENNIKS